MQMRNSNEERSLGELFSELASATSTLIQKEMQLAKVEMTRTVANAGREVAFVAAGGALAYAGLLALVAAVMIGLDRFIPLWLSALIVGLAVVGLGYFLIQKGLTALKNLDPTPRQTVETLKEDKEWAKEQIR
jgi:hypothetical protein